MTHAQGSRRPHHAAPRQRHRLAVILLAVALLAGIAIAAGTGQFDRFQGRPSCRPSTISQTLHSQLRPASATEVAAARTEFRTNPEGWPGITDCDMYVAKGPRLATEFVHRRLAIIVRPGTVVEDRPLGDITLILQPTQSGQHATVDYDGLCRAVPLGMAYEQACAANPADRAQSVKLIDMYNDKVRYPFTVKSQAQADHDLIAAAKIPWAFTPGKGPFYVIEQGDFGVVPYHDLNKDLRLTYNTVLILVNGAKVQKGDLGGTLLYGPLDPKTRQLSLVFDPLYFALRFPHDPGLCSYLSAGIKQRYNEFCPS